jgi:hypothetical protein
LSLAACSSGEDGAREEAETLDAAQRAFCRGSCDLQARCGGAHPSCVSLCVDDYHPTGFREGTLADVGACVAQEDCSVLDAELPFEPCFDEVSAIVATTAPTQVLIDYCEGASQRLFECGSWFSVDDCIDGMALWNDDVLIEASGCLREQCGGLQDCETEVFDKYR